MDPNETLRLLRELLGRDHSGYETNREGTAIRHDGRPALDIGELHDRLCRAEELFQAIDGWLSKGGFLPHAWIKAAPTLRDLRSKGDA